MEVKVLNLDKSPERLALFLKTNQHLNTISRISAIDGRMQSRKELQAKNILAGDMHGYSAGAIGCALSHLKQWKVAVQENKVLTIAEDDAIFHHQFELFAEKILSMLPKNWDIIQWGWNFDAILAFDLLPGVSICAGTFDQSSLRANTHIFQSLPIGPVPYRLKRSFGTVCQSVSPSGAEKLLKHCLPIRELDTYYPLLDYPLLDRFLHNRGIDTMMNDLYPQINAYVCVPPLVVTKNEHELSTIQSAD
jgi:glycosyl transferase, family 25